MESWEFYGKCKLCACKYMGGANHQCSCGHGKINHVELGACRDDDCNFNDCPGFQSTDDISQCYHCLHEAAAHTSAADNESVEEELLRNWVLQGHKLDVVRQLYNQKFGITLSTRSIARRLSAFKIRYCEDSKVTDDQILSAIKEEHALGVLGYRRLHTSLRVKYGLAVTRDRVTALIKSHDLPRGVDPKVGRGPLHQNPLRSKTPLKKTRAKKWSEEEKAALAQGVCSRYRVIFGKGVDGDQQRPTAWAAVLQEVESVRADVQRSLFEVKHQWRLLKSKAKLAAVERKRRLNRTDGGPAPPDLAPIYELIVAALPDEGILGLGGVDTGGERKAVELEPVETADPQPEQESIQEAIEAEPEQQPEEAEQEQQPEQTQNRVQTPTTRRAQTRVVRDDQAIILLMQQHVDLIEQQNSIMNHMAESNARIADALEQIIPKLN